jgi:hypothetical protein
MYLIKCLEGDDAYWWNGTRYTMIRSRARVYTDYSMALKDVVINRERYPGLHYVVSKSDDDAYHGGV